MHGRAAQQRPSGPAAATARASSTPSASTAASWPSGSEKRRWSIAGTMAASAVRSRTTPWLAGFSTTGISETGWRPVGRSAASRSHPTFGSTCRSKVPPAQRELAAFSFDCTWVRMPRASSAASCAASSSDAVRRTCTAGWSTRLRPTPGEVGDDVDAERAQLVRRADAAAQQDRRRAVGARGEHDRAGLDHAGARGVVARRRLARGPARPPRGRPARRRRSSGSAGREPGSRYASAALQRVRPRRLTGTRPAPRDGGLVVEVVERRLAERLPAGERRAGERAHLIRLEPAGADRRLGPGQQRRHARPAPRLVPGRRRPLVVVGRRAPHDEAAVVRRGAADDAARHVGAVAPVVRSGAVGRIEQVGRPAAGVVVAVVGSGLDEADDRSPRSDRRAASTQPAAPAPTTHTSARPSFTAKAYWVQDSLCHA